MSRTTRRWSAFQKFDTTRDAWLFYVGPRTALIIPKRAFADDQRREIEAIADSGRLGEEHEVVLGESLRRDPAELPGLLVQEQDPLQMAADEADCRDRRDAVQAVAASRRPSRRSEDLDGVEPGTQAAGGGLPLPLNA